MRDIFVYIFFLIEESLMWDLFLNQYFSKFLFSFIQYLIA